MIRLTKILNEVKPEQVYFHTYSGAIDAALDMARKRGYEIDEDSLHQAVTFHYPGRPKKNKTSRATILLTKNGKPQKKALQIQVYNMDDRKYELNAYIN
jgi:hypothetical protein